MGLDPSRITEILNKSRGIKIEEAVEMADYLETSLDDLVTKLGTAVATGARASSLVVGYVGAGETVLSIDDHEKGSGLCKIEAPQGEGGGVCGGARQLHGAALQGWRAPRLFPRRRTRPQIGRAHV